ncbi:DUF1822 family protein [Nostoc sp. TCL26-01]|uniref:DUF1822 family protein n=1 Tax=Nostoc sp. TCL26-01 TaxID=2576904 RepID=UPI0015BB4FC3|nr:DUF1822 family protein [Nostoc sp. TCL26-01]QLE59819.1 DUF1822 family protein [Nostoc sp. TCL26-01]
MKMNLSDLIQMSFMDTEQLWLEISATDLEKAKLIAQKCSNTTAQINAQLNDLCLRAFISWLKEHLEDSPVVVSPTEDLLSIWEVVNGSAIAIGQTRVILIPSEATDTEEFSVPQEWVDIPSWMANYYLAVQIDLEQGWMRIWGYTTHRTLKTQGRYDPIYRTYSLNRDLMIDDLEVMWLAREICPDEIAPIAPISVLDAGTAQTLLTQLSQPSPYSPRLDIEFTEWAALMASDRLRQQLYQLRCTQVVAETPKKPWLNLSAWLNRNFTESMQLGWQEISALLTPASPQLAYRINSIENTIKQAKLINLRMLMGEVAVVLLVAITPEADGRVGVQVQVHPDKQQKYLPPALKLVLLSESEAVFPLIMAGEQDSYIQTPYFRCSRDTQFQIQIALDQVSVTENFAVLLSSHE